MDVDIQKFITTNKRILIWSAFFLLLFLVRKLFALVFLTFILCFIFHNLTDFLSRKIRLPRRVWTVVVYLVFVALVVTIISFIAPKVGSEATIFLKRMPENLDRFHNYLDTVAAKQPNLAPVMERLKLGISIKTFSGMNRDTLVNVLLASLDQVAHYFTFFLVGTLFSFFVLFDFPNLREKTLALRNTRFKEIYEETAVSVARFALVVGSAFQAQIMIALVNTILTALGLWGLGIHPITLLATIVFFCGLIPVLGVFISSAPILLLAFNTGGLNLVLGALVMIIVVHTIETYILNPNIFSVVLHINPVLTLMILYIAYSLFGLWGMLLGVPISVYVYRYVVLNHDQASHPTPADG